MLKIFYKYHKNLFLFFIIFYCFSSFDNSALAQSRISEGGKTLQQRLDKEVQKQLDIKKRHDTLFNASEQNLEASLIKLNNFERKQALEILNALSDDYIKNYIKLGWPILNKIDNTTIFLGHALGNPSDLVCNCIYSIKKQHYGHYLQMAHGQAIDAHSYTLTYTQGVKKEYKWRELEPAEGEYNFKDITDDLALLEAQDKQLIIELNLFEKDNKNIPSTPDYMKHNKNYGGTVTGLHGNFPVHPSIGKWHPMIWNAAVKQSLKNLIKALGSKYTLSPNIEGISIGISGMDFLYSGLSCKEYLKIIEDIALYTKGSFYNKTVLFNIDYLCISHHDFLKKLKNNFIGVEVSYVHSDLINKGLLDNNYYNQELPYNTYTTALVLEYDYSSDTVENTFIDNTKNLLGPSYVFWKIDKLYNDFYIEQATISYPLEQKLDNCEDLGRTYSN